MKAAFLSMAATGLLLSQQIPNPTQTRALSPTQTGQPAPIFRVTVVSRTTKAINYHHRTGSTKMDFRGTELMPTARGEAKVESQMGSTKIETRLEKLTPAATIRTGIYYVRNVGNYAGRATREEPRRGRAAKAIMRKLLCSHRSAEHLGLIVTAEPYFAVTQPSDVVVMRRTLSATTPRAPSSRWTQNMSSCSVDSTF